MRVFHAGGACFDELGALPGALPEELPDTGFLWIGITRDELVAQRPALQERLQRWTGGPLVDLHVADLLNEQLPSHYDYTSWYDLLVFRRLLAGSAPSAGATADDGRPLDNLETSPVGFAVFDRVLITVHPADCAVRDYFAQRLQGLAASTIPADSRTGARLPTSPADLMVRMVNHMVDSYLELRRSLTRRLDVLQQRLFDPKGRFQDWQVLLTSRKVLHLLEDTCEDQRAAVQEWVDALDEWEPADDPQEARERELLRVRSRDVLEHIGRVLAHVRRLEHSVEAAVQMHFSALGHRTNDIMRTLTALTAIFLPLNLITGVFGMNFEALPLIRREDGFWIAAGLMLLVGTGLVVYFRRKRYLEQAGR